MRLRHFLLVGCFVLSTSIFATFKHYRVPDVDVALSNALRLVEFRDERIPLIAMHVVFPFGYRNDPKGKAGLVSLLSSVLKRGNNGRSASEVVRALELLGAELSVRAGEDQTVISVEGLSRDWKALLHELRLAVTHPNLEEKEVRFVKDLVSGSIKHLIERPSAIAGTLLGKELFASTPYERGTFDRLREIKKVSAEDLKKFHKEQFIPGGAIFMVVGKIEDSSFQAEVEKEFSEWRSNEKHTFGLAPVKYERKDIPKSLFVYRKGLTQANVMMGLRMPAIRHPDRPALAVANVILGRMFTSRLMRIVRDELGWTYSIMSQFSDEGYYSNLEIVASTRNEKVGPLLNKVNEIVESLWKHPPSAEEVQNAVSFILGSAPIEFSSIGAFAQSWLGYEVMGYPKAEAEAVYDKFSAITPKDVREAVERHLKGRKWTYAIAGSIDAVNMDLKGWQKIDAATVLAPYFAQ